MLKEFKKFLISGNVVDMAVGFIFGAAFATFVKSLVTNVVMPPISLLLGKIDFSQLFMALDGNNYATLAELEKVGTTAPKTKVCSECAKEIPVAAKKCGHCVNTTV